MVRSRVTRVIALLVLLLAQAALALPHRLMAETVAASVPSAGPMAHEHCNGGAAGDTGVPAGSSHSNAPMPPCGSCPASMPGSDCVQMASCGPGSVASGAALVAVLPAVVTADIPPTISSPAAHDFVPDPPPPRA